MSRFVRASDAERDRALAVLRDGVVSGRLSDSTFIRRVDLALRARTRAEVHRAVADLPSASNLVTAFVDRLRTWLPRVQLRDEPRVQVPGLHLPGDQGRPVRIGRGFGADLRLWNDTVSRMHAELARTGPNAWTLTDLGSMNGTFLNGARIAGAVEVRHGDLVHFGTVAYRLYVR